VNGPACFYAALSRTNSRTLDWRAAGYCSGDLSDEVNAPRLLMEWRDEGGGNSKIEAPHFCAKWHFFSMHVPEGRRDSRSQVRSAWFGVRNDARPRERRLMGGSVPSVFVPEFQLTRASLETLDTPLESCGADDGQPDSGCNETLPAAQECSC
jgi:hypothetical protein